MVVVNLLLAMLTLFPPTDSRVRIMGRHEVVTQDSVRFAASGVVISVQFRGTSVAVDLHDEFRGGSSYNWFTVMIDGVEHSRFRTLSGQTRYVLAESLPAGSHRLDLIKDTEGQNGWNALTGIHAEALAELPPAPERKIEFIGDSITCGFGVDDSLIGCKDGTWFDQHRASHAFGPLTARRFNAQYMLTGFSGMGMYRNWNSLAPVVPQRYDGVFADYEESPAWTHASFSPQLIMVAVGTNDFSDGDGVTPRAAFDPDAYLSAYSGFVARLRSVHPQAKILLTASPTMNPERLAMQLSLLRQIPGVTVYSFKNRYNQGCNGHPNAAEQRQMSDELIPVISSLMSWP
jgi:lysophospholipase L1-like esterase